MRALNFRYVLPLAIACGVSSLTQSGWAADQATPDWPCISRKVVELSAAQIWDGPAIDGFTDWRDDDKVRTLSEYLIARRIPLDDVELAIKKFAGELPADARDQKLTELFAAVLSRTNDERKIVMAGIERFHKRQLGRAKEIENEGTTLNKPGVSTDLPDATGGSPGTPPPPADASTVTVPGQLSDAEQRYNWDVRIFQERQQNIPIACEIPGLIEERVGAVARAIRGEMKS